MSAAAGASEDLIRAARTSSNQALLRQDIDGIARLWMDDVIVLGSTPVQLAGAPANRSFYQSQFTSRPDTA